MTSLDQIPSLLAFVRKLFSQQYAELYLLAVPGSMSLMKLLEVLIDGSPLKELFLPLLIAALCLSLYFITFLLDFFSGVKASRHEAADKDNYFSSAKGWSSIWKLATVFLLVTWSSLLAILALLAGLSYLYTFFIICAGTMAFMAALLDIHSIGENQKRLTGKKAKFFEWLETLMHVFNEGLMERVRRFLKSEDRSPKSED